MMMEQIVAGVVVAAARTKPPKPGADAIWNPIRE